MYLSEIQKWSKRFQEGCVSFVNARSEAAKYVSDQHIPKMFKKRQQFTATFPQQSILAIVCSHNYSGHIETPYKLPKDEPLDTRTRDLSHSHVYNCCRITTEGGGNVFQQRLQQKQTDSPPPKKFKIHSTISGEITLLFFFNHKGLLVVGFLEHGASMNAQCYL